MLCDFWLFSQVRFIQTYGFNLSTMLTELESSVKRLISLSFKEKVDTLITGELCMLESTLAEDVAFQAVANGSEFECFLTFRDKLCSNEYLVQQYNELKKSCEGLSQEAYRSKKSEFIAQVLTRA